eukprot:scaffold180_cov311-Pinguiococcus_pyrenoidosus.AAC.24
MDEEELKEVKEDLLEHVGDGPSVDWLKFIYNPFSEKATHEALPLRAENLEKFAEMRLGTDLPAQEKRVADSYIAHIGVGGFHRSHQAYVLNQLMQKEDYEGEKWGIIGVGLMPWDEKMYNTLTEQDYLYTLLMRSKQGSTSCVVGSILDFIFVPEDAEASLERLCDPSVKIISLTVTEKGYYRNVEGRLDTGHDVIQDEISNWQGADKGIAVPKTSFGLIATVLVRRKAAGIAPVTVMSCDNLPMNGDTVKGCMYDFLEQVEPDLMEWVKTEVTFPNSMVDRITPATEENHRSLISEEFGIKDGWPVVAEPFLQWVIEDHFVYGRPPWHLVDGVLFTDKVAPYEFMKLRLLNSTHSALSYVAYLVGHRFVDDAMADCDVFYFVKEYMREIAETVPQVPGIDLEKYQKTLTERFANPYIKDKIVRLAEDGSQKFQNTLIEALHEKLHGEKEVPDMVALAIACYLRYMAGKDEECSDIDIKDPFQATLSPLALEALNGERESARDSAMQFIRALLGEAVAGWGPFCDRIWEHYESLVKKGTKVIIREVREDAVQRLEEGIEQQKKKLREMQRLRITLLPKEQRVRSLSTVFSD